LIARAIAGGLGPTTKAKEKNIAKGMSFQLRFQNEKLTRRR
jgi:hypothetical protein